MAMPVITADSTAGRILLALRAGSMIGGELDERIGGYSTTMKQLTQGGLVEVAGNAYRLTPAGRAACPFRNPLAARTTAPAHQGPIMPRENCISRPGVLKAIQATGATGITRKELIDHFGGEAAAIDNHIYNLSKALAIYKPEKGRLVAAEHYKPESKPAEATPAPVPQAVVQDEPEVSLHKETEAPTPARLDSLASAIVTLASNDVVELDTADGLEIALYNTGRLVITSEDGTVEMSKEVVIELRNYLGLFMGDVVGV